jgi:hypothetical protein
MIQSIFHGPSTKILTVEGLVGIDWLGGKKEKDGE